MKIKQENLRNHSNVLKTNLDFNDKNVMST